MFSDDVISRVRDSVDIVDIVSGYVSLKKTGKNYVGLCPFHAEKTPSFTVNTGKQIFHCFGCGAGGDVFKFLESQEGLNFPEALRQLAGKAGITLPESRPRAGEKKSDDERKALLSVIAEAADFFRKELEGPAGSAARAYLKKRGLSDSIVKDFSLGWARSEWDALLRHLKQKGHPAGLMEKAGLIVKRSEGDGYYDRFRGRIIFPIRDLGGNIVAFGGRVMDDSLPKYLNSPETPLYSKSNVLYCLDRAKEQGRKLGYFIIVEGYLDAIACHQFGVQNAVATLGTALTEGHLRQVRRFAQKLVLIFDPDPAGVKAAIRGFDPLVQSGMKVNVVSLPDGTDPDTFFHKYGKDEFDAVLRSSVKLMDFVLAQVIKVGSTAPIDERMDTAKEVASFIEKIPDRNVQQFYIKKIIERDALDIDEALFRQERFRDSQTSRKIQDKVSEPALKRRPQAELMLIHLMLRDENMARSIRGDIAPEEFTDPLYRRAAEKIFSLLDISGGLDVKALLNDDDEELSGLITHYATLDIDYSDPQKHRNDCVSVIKQQNHEKKIKTLMRAMNEAEARGDWAEYRKLREEQNQLYRKPGRRVPGL